MSAKPSGTTTRVEPVGTGMLSPACEFHFPLATALLVFGIEGAGSWGAGLCQYERQLTRPLARRDPPRRTRDRPISAAKLLACDPTRFKHEAAFARCNGTAPLPASSGKTVRHRLNRGGDRQVNNAIHTIALIRAKHQP